MNEDGDRGETGEGRWPWRHRSSTRVALPNRFRRRLTIAFVAVAGIASAALAGGTYLGSRHYRVTTLADRSVRQARVNLALTAGRQNPAELDRFFDVYRELGGVETMAIGGDGSAKTSLPSLGPEDVPPSLRNVAPGDQVATANVSFRGDPYFVVAGKPRDSPVTLYFFFSRRGVFESLSTLRTSLLIGWIVIVAVAALVGRAVARTTLAPVRATAEAARSVTEGLLSARVAPGTDDEFGALASYFNRMVDALEEQIAALSEARDREKRFTAFAAHELRTPLTGMCTAASLIEEDIDELPERARRPAQLLVADVTRLRQLVLDLLELGRLDSDVSDLQVERLELDSLVATAIRGVQWEVDVGLDLSDVEIVSDPWSLERIVVKLLANAVRHGGRAVEVRVRPSGTGGVVEVRDGGRGIPEADLPRLFDRFYTNERRAGGSGLGLAIVREHADRIGANVNIRSPEGVGTTVVVTVPSLPEEQDDKFPGTNGHRASNEAQHRPS